MTKMKIRLNVLALVPFVLMLACGGGGDGVDDGGVDDGEDDDGGGAAAGSELPFEGTLTLDHDDWIDLIEDYYGVIQVGLPSGRVRRFLDGHDGSQHPRDGSTAFLQGCGASASRVAVADERGADIRLLTPCSNELSNPEMTTTNFAKPVLSLDATRVALQTSYAASVLNYSEFGFLFYNNVVVYDMQGNQLGQAGGWAPAWTPDGRLVFGTNDGLYLADGALAETPVRIDDGQLTGPVYDPKVHPDGNSAIFEYNQRIWQINLDGSGLEELAYGSARLSSPAYSPDGTAIAFLASEGEPGALLYLKHIAGDEYYSLDLRGQLSSDASDSIPGGPITWTP